MHCNNWLDAILLQIMVQLHVGACSTTSIWTVQYSLCTMGFWSQWPTQVLLFTPWHKALLLRDTTTGCCMIGNLVREFVVLTVSNWWTSPCVEKTPWNYGCSMPTRENPRPGSCYGVECFQLACLRTPHPSAECSEQWMLYIHPCRSFAPIHDLHALQRVCPLSAQPLPYMSTIIKFWLEEHSSKFGMMIWPLIHLI